MQLRPPARKQHPALAQHPVLMHCPALMQHPSLTQRPLVHTQVYSQRECRICAPGCDATPSANTTPSTDATTGADAATPGFEATAGLVQHQAQVQHLSLALMQHQAQAVQQVQGECRCRECSVYLAEPAFGSITALSHPTLHGRGSHLWSTADSPNGFAARIDVSVRCLRVSVQSSRTRTCYCLAPPGAGAAAPSLAARVQGAAPPSKPRRSL